MKKILVVVDMQNDFVTGSLGTPEAQKIAEGIREKIETEKEKGSQIIFTKDTHDNAYLSTQEGKNLPVIHCIEGQAGWELIPLLKGFEADSRIFNKNTFGSWDLAKFIADSDCSEVELIGLCTDICILSNALLIKAASPELPISVPSDLCAGVTPKSHQNALEAMKMCQIQIK